MIGKNTFERLAKIYQQKYQAALVCVDASGEVVYGKHACGRMKCLPDCSACRSRAVLEALRWGEPSVNSCPQNYALWAIPLMENSRVYGGLVAAGIVLEKDHLKSDFTSAQIQEACTGLRLLAEEANLTNAALLELNRRALNHETEKALAIHALKTNAYDSIREIYLREEAALLAAVKRGERREARKILNRVLVGIYHFGAARMNLLKSMVLELVIMLCRAAVEAGAEPSELLGVNYHSISELAAIKDEKALSDWLTGMLERQMDAIRDHQTYPNTVLLGKALAYMKEHIGAKLGRNEVARNAGLSPSHFSHLMKEQLGRTFTELLGQYRIDHAQERLIRTSLSLAEIAGECGFSDQSYFCKVFLRYTGMKPSDYRRRYEG